MEVFKIEALGPLHGLIIIEQQAKHLWKYFISWKEFPLEILQTLLHNTNHRFLHSYVFTTCQAKFWCWCCLLDRNPWLVGRLFPPVPASPGIRMERGMNFLGALLRKIMCLSRKRKQMQTLEIRSTSLISAAQNAGPKWNILHLMMIYAEQQLKSFWFGRGR